MSIGLRNAPWRPADVEPVFFPDLDRGLAWAAAGLAAASLFLVWGRAMACPQCKQPWSRLSRRAIPYHDTYAWTCRHCAFRWRGDAIAFGEHPTMRTDWWYVHDGERLGPFNFANLRQRARRGLLAPTDWVWRPGMGRWIRASVVWGLCGRPPHAVKLPERRYRIPNSRMAPITF